ncbi:MAG: DUF362 domain-containing protein [Pseudodesulfovibrio sp.]|uniref:DUF362 domain-containing protein n=1 Tax=Pseudodesulfovibrio sp. TaxID=2035812 RepID=UPI003D0BA0C6
MNNISRRKFMKSGAIALATIAMTGHGVFSNAEEGAPVYLTRDISSKGLNRVYDRLMQGGRLSGKVAVKLHSGEPGGHNYPNPSLIKDLVQSVNGTIVECNTAYKGKRFTTADHMKALQDHGFTGIAPVDIMDENGSMALPFPKGSHIRENYVGTHFANYDSFLILSHFKGHAMGGFGGAIKNMSIGIASGEGKMWIHTAGVTRSTDNFAQCFATDQDMFLESMAEAAGSVINKLGTGRIVYVSLMNNLSIDCDCDSHPAPPELDDIGILASMDPVALDRACVDLIYAADKDKSASLRHRMEEKHATHTLDHAEALGIGRQQYTLVGIDA